MHTNEHIEAMLELPQLPAEELCLLESTFNSVYLHPLSTQCALLAAGSVIEATDWVVKGKVRNAVAVVRPPGHHAEAECPMGFCIFGNVALAAHAARYQMGCKRVLIVDWDVHHGNGTQRMFESDPSVLYFSAHRFDQGNFYPGGAYGDYTSVGTGEGEGFSVNVPWSCGMMGDEEYVRAFKQVFMPIAHEFNPDLVLISAGFDAARGDPLGGCDITAAGYGEMTQMLMELAGGRIVLALEGGYNLDSISHAFAACTSALLGQTLPRRAPGVCRPEAKRIIGECLQSIYLSTCFCCLPAENCFCVSHLFSCFLLAVYLLKQLFLCPIYSSICSCFFPAVLLITVSVSHLFFYFLDVYLLRTVSVCRACAASSVAILEESAAWTW